VPAYYAKMPNFLSKHFITFVREKNSCKLFEKTVHLPRHLLTKFFNKICIVRALKKPQKQKELLSGRHHIQPNNISQNDSLKKFWRKFFKICQRINCYKLFDKMPRHLLTIFLKTLHHSSIEEVTRAKKSSWMGAMTFSQITLKRMTVQICQRKKFQIVWENGAPNMTPSINQIFQQNLHYSSIKEATIEECSNGCHDI